jgi:DNA (cytosine-5)-methyltransferase 1
LNVLDLFCGSGGISEGFKLAGFKIVGGVDFDADSVRTFERNFPGAVAICGDLLDFSEKRIKSEFGDLDVDVLVGGPPCQGFSNANRWQSESKDPRNKLFYEFLRFVKVLKPKVVVIENVRGILTKDKGYAKARILQLVENLGYVVSCQVLNASDYGVPQNRYRAFFVAVRIDIAESEFDFSEIRKKTKVTVKDAIGELYKFEKTRDEIRITAEPSSVYRKYLRSRRGVVPNHEVKYPAELTQERISHVPQGGNWVDIPIKLFPTQRNNRHSSAFKRLNEKDCSVTIDTGNAHSNYFHPKFNRIPTVREAARLQSFSDNFEFLGTRSSQYRQVGNAVPPLLARAIAMQLKRYF